MSNINCDSEIECGTAPWQLPDQKQRGYLRLPGLEHMFEGTPSGPGSLAGIWVEEIAKLFACSHMTHTAYRSQQNFPQSQCTVLLDLADLTLSRPREESEVCLASVN